MWRVQLYRGSFYEFVDYSAAKIAQHYYELAYGTEVRIVWVPDPNRRQEPLLIIRWQEVGF
jgi:hypothetical protein